MKLLSPEYEDHEDLSDDALDHFFHYAAMWGDGDCGGGGGDGDGIYGGAKTPEPLFVYTARKES